MDLLTEFHCICTVNTDHVHFYHSLSKRKLGETSSELSFQSDHDLDFCKELRVGTKGVATQYAALGFFHEMPPLTSS